MLTRIGFPNLHGLLQEFPGDYSDTRCWDAFCPHSVRRTHSLRGKYFVRLGTAGSLISNLRIGDVVLATGATHYPGGLFKQYYGEDACGLSVPDFTLTRKIAEVAEERGLKYFLGPVFSSDAFYAEDPEFAKKWSSRGLIAVEMECAGLFAVSLMRGVKTACVLVVSNSLVEDLGYASAENLRGKVAEVAKVVLEALTRV